MRKKQSTSLIRYCYVLLLVLAGYTAHAASISCVAGGGPWATAATWVGGVVPTGADDVTIVAGATVTMNANPGACLSLTMLGTLNFSTNALTLNVGTGGINLNAGGSIIGAGTATFLTTTGNINLNGGTVTSATLVVRTQTTAGILIQGAGGTIPNLTVNSATTNTTALVVSTALAGTNTLTNAANATLNISGTSAITGLTANAVPNTVTYDGAGPQTVKNPTAPAATYHHLVLSGSGAKTMTGISTINGNFTLSGTASTAGVNVNMTIGGKVTIGAGTTFNAGTSLTHNVLGDWQNDGTFSFIVANTIVLSGASLQTISGASTTGFSSLTVTNTTAPFSVDVNSSINVGTTLSVSNAGSSLNPLPAVLINTGAPAGTITGNGTIYVTNVSATPDYVTQYRFTTNTLTNLTVNYSGLGNQIINNAVSPYGNIITSGSGTKSLQAGTTTVNGAVTVAVPTTLSTNTFNLTASRLINNDTFDATSGGNVILTNAATALTNNATFNGGPGTVTLTAGSLLNAAGATMNGSSGTIILAGINGTFTNNGTFNANTGTVNFTAGGGNQNIAGSTSPTNFNNLGTNAGGLTLGVNIVVDGLLTYGGVVTTTAFYNVSVSSTGTTAGGGAGKYVVGNLYKYVNAGSPPNLTFELGDNFTLTYLPVTFANITGVSTPGYAQAKLILPANYETASTPSNADIYTVPTSRRVKRTWSLIDQSGGALAITSFDMTLNFRAADVDPAANTANFIVYLFDGVSWKYPPVIGTPGARTATSTTLLGVTMADQGDFNIGDPVPPAITSQPANAAQCPGLNVSYSVTATGQGLTYQWQSDAGGPFANLSNGALPSGAVVSGATTSSVTITNITASEAANYRVIISGYGTPSTTSNAASLTLNAAPAITAQPPASTTQCAGTNASFTVTATGTALTYQWSKGGSLLTDAGNVSGSKTATLNISNISAADAGDYYVQISGTCTPAVTSTAAALNVDAPIVITSQPASQSQCVSNNATFTVAATGGTLTYQWRQSGTNLVDGPLPSGAVVSGSGTASMTITGITASEAAGYDVVITNSCAPTATSNVATLTVNSPVNITGSPASLSTCSGSNATFSVTATGNSLQYQWRINGTNLTDGGKISGSATATLNIANVTTADNASYDVVVTNSCGATATSSAALLSVDNTAAITSQPATQNQCAGNNVTFTVTATGGDLSYQWRQNGSNLADGPLPSGAVVSGSATASLTITGLTASETANYDVRVSNFCPAIATSGTAVLTVDAPVSITTQPASLVQCAGSNAAFSVAATGSSLKYQWRINGTNLTDGGNISGATSATLNIASISASDAASYDVVITNSCSTTATSTAATLAVDNAAAITGQPASQSQCAGSNVTFTVAATGGNLGYQWRQNGSNLADGPLPSGAVVSGSATASLTITGVTATEAANYDVVITNSCSTTATSSVAVLTVDAPVAISTQPVSLVQCAGSNASFTVTATGNSLKYQWRINGANLTDGSNISGATTATLNIASISASDAASYDVVITNSCSTTATSTAATLAVDNAVAIAGQPASQSQCAGSNVTFTVAATGGNLSYTWRQNGSNLANGPLPSGAVVSGSATATLTITGLTASEAGSYDVVITNACSTTATSGAAVLTIDAAVVVTTQPASSTLCAGSNATFSVTATGNSLKYQWRINGSNLSDGANVSGSSTASLTIANISTNDAATYDVVITNSCSTTATSTGAVLTVNTPVAITSQPVSQNQCSGSTVSFSVTATGGSLSYQWRHAGVNLSNGGNISGATSSTLTLTAISPADAGNYDVVITNACSTTATSNVAALSIDFPAAITTQPSPVTQCAGTNASFSLSATGNNLQYQWRINGVNLSNGANIAGVNTSTLTISNISTSDAATYDVVITNSCSTTLTSTGAALTVNTPVTITADPASLSQCAGNTATFTVSATGGSLNYQWRHAGVNLNNGGNISGATSSTLSISNISLSDAGNYDVVITNTCSTTATSAIATLTVDMPVAITAQPASTTLCAGSNAIFSVTATGNSLQYQWRINGIDLSDGAKVSGSNSSTLTIANISQADSASYDVVITNTCGTSVTSSAAILTVAPSDFKGSIIGDAVVCEGNNSGQVKLVNFTGTVNYWESSTDQGTSWKTIANTALNQPYTNILVTTLYRAVTKNGVCNDIRSPFVVITVNAKPSVDFSYSSSPKAGTPVVFTNKSTVANNNINGTSWSFGDGAFSVSVSPEHTYSKAGTYSVSLVVSTDKGCVDSIRKDIPVITGDVFLISNILTLNDNGENEIWYVEGIDKHPDSEVYIYNRNGKVVYSAAPYKNDWGGTFNGEKLPDGNYFYVIRYKDSNQTYKGSILITR